MKKQLIEWEKIFVNDMTSKGLKFKISNCSSQHKKKKKPYEKLGRSKQTLPQRRHTDGQQAHEKMLSVANYQRNANQNYNEVLPPQNGHHQKSLHIINAGEGEEKKELAYGIGGNVNWCSHYGEQCEGVP